MSRFDLSKDPRRTASGRMVLEIIRSGVCRVDATWRYLRDPELEEILDLLSQNKPFFSLQYEDAGGLASMVCYVGDISYSMWHRGPDGVRIWSEVSMPFIER